MAVQFRGAGRQHEQLDAEPTAGFLKPGHELGATVHLDGFDGEGHAVDDRLQEAGRGVSRGAARCLQDLPTGEDVAGGEVLEGES
jgi:hypothetical protein